MDVPTISPRAMARLRMLDILAQMGEMTRDEQREFEATIDSAVRQMQDARLEEARSA